MDDEETSKLIRHLNLKTLKEALKAEGVKPVRCPTEMSIARMLPEVPLKKLAGRQYSQERYITWTGQHSAASATQDSRCSGAIPSSSSSLTRNLGLTQPSASLGVRAKKFGADIPA